MRQKQIRRSLFLLWAFLILGCSPAVKNFSLKNYSSPRCIAENRDKFSEESLSTIAENLSLPLNPENESKWESAFWAMELMLHRSNSVREKIRKAFFNFNERSGSFQRSLLETIYCLYPSEFAVEADQIARQTTNPKIFAMAVLYATRNFPNQKQKYLDLLKTQFPDQQNHPILSRLLMNLNSEADVTESMPPLIDLLKNPVGTKQTVIFSFQRRNRDFPGLVVIKAPDGKFVRDGNGNVFSVPQLGRSISNLPGYITNGSTPQGIFSIQGIGHSKNDFIGPSPNLQLVMPWEDSAGAFFHDEKNGSANWTREMYQQLLPDSWQNYTPVFEAYDAGAAGRTEIIAHGTTINPKFYRHTPWFPYTPSLGCLTTKEFWSSKTGRNIYSDQIALVNAFLSAGEENGYLVVIELNDAKKPVTLDDVILEILKAEGEL